MGKDKSIEEKLKELILSRHKSIREFSHAIHMPYSTLDSIFKRGINKASVTNIINICQYLGISADMLSDGQIISSSAVNLENSEILEVLAQRYNLSEDAKGFIKSFVELDEKEMDAVLKFMGKLVSVNNEMAATIEPPQSNVFADEITQAKAILDKQEKLDKLHNDGKQGKGRLSS